MFKCQKQVFRSALNLKKQKYEKMVSSFDPFFKMIESSADIALSSEEERSMAVAIEESKAACMAGMLMCLDRSQRLVYIVGEVFEIDHQLASEIFEISPDNFRQKLSRARKDLHQWMHGRCGLVNQANPCRCPKKTKGFIANGWVDPENLKWQSNYAQRITDFSESKVDEALLTIDDLYARLYREHPFKIPRNPQSIVAEVLNHQKIRH